MKAKLQETYKQFINGQWAEAGDGKTFATKCPANGEHLAYCAEATREDVDKAVKAAQKAWESWKKTSPQERAEILMKVADVIEANKEHLAMVETLDNGKPIRETMAIDIPFAADHFRYFAGVIRAEEGSASMLDEGTLSLILHEPIGVVGQIVPWNFPFLMAAWKLAPVPANSCWSMANDNRYGLGGAVWTRDINRALRVCRGIETGRMWVNTYNAIPGGAPFGGYKESGIGRETHKIILSHYTQMKNIMVNLNEVPSGFY